MKGSSKENYKERLCITLDSDVLEAVRRFAAADDRPVSSYINRCLKLAMMKELEKEKEKEKEQNQDREQR